jgi:hypothetical protein
LVIFPVTDLIESFGSQASETVSVMVGGASSNVVNDILDVMVSMEEKGTLDMQGQYLQREDDSDQSQYQSQRVKDPDRKPPLHFANFVFLIEELLADRGRGRRLVRILKTFSLTGYLDWTMIVISIGILQINF